MTSDKPTQNFGLDWEVAVRSILSPKPDTLAENEDNFLVIDSLGLSRCLQNHEDYFEQLTDWPTGHIRVAVMDGMGGHNNGRQVSEATARGLMRIPACTALDILSEHLDALHGQLQAQFSSTEPHSRPGCTLTLIEIPPEAPPLLYHVGDSRLYDVDQQQAHCLTLDHVPALQAAIEGNLDASIWQQQVFYQEHHVISQAFVLGGKNDAIEAYDDPQLPDFLKGMGDRRVLMPPQGIWLLASDGLWARSDSQAFLDRWPKFFADKESKLQHQLDDLFFEHILRYDKDQAIDNGKDHYVREEHSDNCTAIALRRTKE